MEDGVPVIPGARLLTRLGDSTSSGRVPWAGSRHISYRGHRCIPYRGPAGGLTDSPSRLGTEGVQHVATRSRLGVTRAASSSWSIQATVMEHHRLGSV